jgi:uncharacterized linocin/CFP29 family protein
MAEMRDADRGADDVDFGPLDGAAHQIAVAENIAVFDGWEGAFSGILEISLHEPIQLGEKADRYPRAVAGAVELLLQSGVGGPYGLALGSEQYRLVARRLAGLMVGGNGSSVTRSARPQTGVRSLIRRLAVT